MIKGIKMNCYELVTIRAFLECAVRCLSEGNLEEALKEVENAIEFIDDYHNMYY